MSYQIHRADKWSKKAMEGTPWFKRFYKDCKKMSDRLKFVRIKHGFYRIYWVSGGQAAYVHEVYKEMPPKGYDIEEKDMRLQSKKYYEEFEDHVEYVRTIKNFVEGYYDSIKKIKKRLYMLRNNKEFRQKAVKKYKQIKVK